MLKKGVAINFRVSDYWGAMLTSESKIRNVSKTELLRQIIEEHFQSNEHKARKDKEINARLDALQEFIIELNKMVHELSQNTQAEHKKSLDILAGAMQKVARSIVVTNEPQLDKLKKIFTNPKIIGDDNEQ